jgi:hypothetical protein
MIVSSQASAGEAEMSDLDYFRCEERVRDFVDGLLGVDATTRKRASMLLASLPLSF